MRIVVNDIAAEKGGALTVLKEFYNCVKENDRENEWIFLLGENLLEETERIKIITLPEIKNSRKKKLLFDLFTGKKYINSLNPDVVFSLQNTATFGVKVPQIIYLHQSIPFQETKKFSFFKSNERSLAIYQYFIGWVIKKSVKACDKVIVQTKWMKEAVCKKCRLPEERVAKITPNVSDIALDDTADKFQKNRFFYPTSEIIYKNNSAIFKACEILNGKGLDYKVTLTISEKHSRENIECVGRLPYNEVIENYAKSTLIFPSYIETFGYPMAEARKVGTVVLASDCPFSREILDGYENAYFFDPFKPEELAELMEKVISDEIIKVKSEAPHSSQKNSWLSITELICNMK